MQLLNISIMAVCVYLFIKHAPFKILYSVLIVFGYFFIYEYNIISRNYAVSLLCLTLVFIQLNRPVKNHLLLSFYLILLSFTHVYSIIVAIAVCCLLIFQHKNSNIKYVYATIIAFTFLLLCTLKVPANHFLFKYDTEPYLSYKRIGKGFSVYLKGFLPIPDPTANSAWNSNLIISLSKIAGAIFSVICLISPFFIFRKNKLILFFFYFSTLTICFFIYVSPLIVSVRYCGFIFVIFIFSFWLQKTIYPQYVSKNLSYSKIIIAVLLLHVISGMYLFTIDIKRPFSNSKNLTNYLIDNKLADKEMCLSNLCTGPSVSAYLNKKITYLETGEKNSFCKWNTWPFILTKEQISEKLSLLVKKDTSLFILSTTYQQGNIETLGQLPGYGFTLIKLHSFEKAIVNSENYTLYYLIRD